MSTRELIGTANQLYAGRAFDPGLFGILRSKGRPVSLITKVNLGTPKLAVADSLIKAATSTEMPNAATKTYVPGVTTSPLDSTDLPSTATIQTVDGQVLCWVLDVPRGVTTTVTHSSSIVATTVRLTGYDLYRSKVVEDHVITATGTTKTVAGKKAIKYLAKIEITSAGNATTNTANIGFNDVLGLPYRIAAKSDLLSVWLNDAVDAATVVAAVATSPATATTGDVRGTIDTNGALDGTKTLVAYLHVSDNDAATRNGLLGVRQFAG
jgi:hypothetical protein